MGGRAARRDVGGGEVGAAAAGGVAELVAKASGFTRTEVRDALGASRKVAVPLRDYFDTVKLTVRTANRRTPGAEAKKLL